MRIEPVSVSRKIKLTVPALPHFEMQTKSSLHSYSRNIYVRIYFASCSLCPVHTIYLFFYNLTIKLFRVLYGASCAQYNKHDKTGPKKKQSERLDCARQAGKLIK